MTNLELGGWLSSAQAWIDSQGAVGDRSRHEIIDPCLESIIGDVRSIDALDVGCGEGRYTRVLAAKGANVTGIDPVELFIDRARELLPTGTYIKASGESLPLPDASFDFVISYLSIVDIPDYRAAIREMARVLKPTGRIVVVTVSNVASTSDGWVKDPSGRKLYRSVDRYMEEFELDLAWSGIHIVNFHRPLSAILGEFFAAGLVLDGMHEPLPPTESDWYQDEFRCPTFQIMTLRYS